MDRFRGTTTSSSSFHHFQNRPLKLPQQQLPTTTTVPSSSRGFATTPDYYDPSQFADPEDEDDDDDDDDIHMSQPLTLDQPTTGSNTTGPTRMMMRMQFKQEDPGMNDQYHSNNNYSTNPTTHMELLVPYHHHHDVGLLPLSSSSPDPVGSHHMMDAVTVSSAGTVQTYSSLVSHTTSRSSISSNSNCHHVGSNFRPHGAAAAHPFHHDDNGDDDDHLIPEPNRKRPHFETPPVTLSLSVPEGTVDIPRVKTEMSWMPTSRILQDDVSRLSSEPPSQSVPHPTTMMATTTTTTAIMMSSIGAPRARLHHWYARPPRGKILSNGHYHCWPDSLDQTHIQQWTAILVCPMTGELFRAGPCPSFFAATPITLTHHHHQACTTWWFAKKTYAEHGAAARAYDCWILRDGDPDAPKMMGTEPPDREPIYRLPDLMVIPYEIRQNILRQQAEIRRIGGLPPV